MSNLITPQIVQRNTFIWTAYYLAQKPKVSVWRNRHMNAFGSDGFENVMLGTQNPSFDKLRGKRPKITDDNVRLLIMDFLSTIDWTKLQGTSKINLLTLLSDSVKANKELLHDNAKVYEIGQDYVDAFVVDLINFIGVRMGVDYAMYTRDVYGSR